jgi:hypothetical protein
LFIHSNNTGSIKAHAKRLKRAYPEHIIAINTKSITWSDGTVMQLFDNQHSKSQQEKLDAPSLTDQLTQPAYIPGMPKHPAKYTPSADPGRIRYEPFFRKMYGNSPDEVRAHLVQVAWMPNVFGAGTYVLHVTTVNKVHEKIAAISQELEALVRTHPNFIPFLKNPGGTFSWRLIANTNRLSGHSFGMTIDINAALSHYWQWDLKEAHRPISEDAVLTYRNQIPWEIVLIFEKYGFIWGGKWYHYDTMHFEYRPELFSPTS